MNVLIVGALQGKIGLASQIAIDRGDYVKSAPSIDVALEVLRCGLGISLVMIDVDLDVVGFMASLKRERISVSVVVCGCEANHERVVAAINAGAQEYVSLPPDPEFISGIFSAIAQQDYPFIFKDPKMEIFLQKVKKVSRSDASVLLTGESGTGKEVLSRFIHHHSQRFEKKFITLNCAAIPDNLLESELFGHEKGSFTGALARRIGKFEQADGGTLLLDEISEMDIRLQAKLLRVIQEREIERIGSHQTIKVNVRLIATSNCDLLKAIDEGKFRQDLYYRLNVLSFCLPPLRERVGDISVLADHFIDKYAQLNGLCEKKLTPQALQVLQGYHWPGNIRELENTMHRIVLLSDLAQETIDQDHIQFENNDMNKSVQPYGQLVGSSVADVERGLIIKTLNHCLGNRTQAAQLLGISIRTLRNKLSHYQKTGHQVPSSTKGIMK